MHTCPSPGCERIVPADQFACKPHWFSLPKPLRDALWRAWRADDMETHAGVRDECVRFLEQKAAAS